MSIQRVAVIFDNRSRPETTGVYCRRALGQLVEVEHFLPTELSRIPRDGFDLYLNIDDGYRFRLPADLRPAAWWAIDTHMDLEWYLTKGPDFDHVFVAQRDGAAALQQAGIKASWLPLACDPEIHAPQASTKVHDICFVGSVTPDRQAWLEFIRAQFPNTHVGRAYFDEMAHTYSRSRIVFNRSVRNDVNMRVFEALGCGAFLLTNDIAGNGLEELFAIGRELEVYRTPEELAERIRFYLEHPSEREQIARAGRSAALEKHTYVHRMRTILDTYAGPVGRSVPKLAASPKLQDRTYYEFPRPEVLALVPSDAARVLDVGCGAGRLGATLKTRQSCHVTGLELVPDAAAIAASRLDLVLNANIESDETGFPDGSFDCVICADVLEHLREPGRVLDKIRRWLSPGGCLVTSIPNVRHHTVVSSLIEGNWTYQPAGLLDNTHLRFFTRREIEKLLFRAGFDAGEWQFVPGAGYEKWAQQADRSELHVGKLNIAGLDPADAQEFHAYQYLIRTRPATQPAFGLTSVILVTFNQVELTRDCLKSLRRFTDEPVEILVVDNGSTDGTVDFLRSQPDVQLIANADNRGFGAAVNQGIAAAKGDQFVVLNNDVVLTTGWLRRMLAALHQAPKIGLVGPCTNCTSGAQRVGPVQYRMRGLDDFAWRWAQRNAGQVQDVPELTGFCLLIRRSVVEQIGALDEQFGIHCFEDVDFCRRAIAAGFRAIIARDVYIHHYGHRSYSGAGLNQDELAKEGERLFRAKWKLPSDDVPESAATVGPSTSPGQQPVPAPSWSEIANGLIPANATNVLIVGAEARRLGVDARLRTATWDALENCLDLFDCIVACGLADAPDLGGRLANLRGRLGPNGTLIAEFPNTRHKDVVAGLLDGSWSSVPIADSGSQDPFRFLTRREIERLLDRAGFELDRLEAIAGDDHSRWLASGAKDQVDFDRLRIAGLETKHAEEFFVDGYVVRGQCRPAKSYGLTSIILVTHNEVEYTRRCLESIAWRTDEPYEVVVVDNGSTDATVPYLQSLSGVTLSVNPDNRGFPAAVNQGLQVASGQQILLLNNDTVVTTGWLRRMLDVLQLDPRIGLVGPCSNRVSGEQQVPVAYDNLQDLDGFAWDWAKAHRGELFETDRLVGFCLLFRQEVIQRIGGMDERFGIGCFEDDDFSRRALQVGYRAVIAKESFVHHFGSRTFLGSGIDLGHVLEENRAKYDAKWEPPRSPAPGPVLPRWTLTISAEGGLQLVPLRVQVSLCMIVRDNVDTIRPCLESIRPWVDEMIVVDTGSRDETPQIARELGARVYEFPWCDDFAAARNESLRYAAGEWLFWMDSDDTISAECGRKLRELAIGSHPENVLGYVIQVHCPAPTENGTADVTVVDHVKLFRNSPELRFEGRIHEQIIPAIRRLGGDVAWTDLYVTHSGSDHSPEGRARKLERDFRLLRLELEEKPEHPFVLFNLGMTHVDAEQFEEANRYLRRYLQVASPVESTYRKGYALLVASLCRTEEFDEAWNVCRKGLEHFPDDKELLFRSGVIHHQLGKLRESVQAYLRVLNEHEDRHFTSVDRALCGYKARHNLALVYEELNDLPAAEREWRRIIDTAPEYRPGWAALRELLLRQQKFASVESLVAEADRASAKQPHLMPEAQLCRARLAELRGDTSRAHQLYRELQSRYASDPPILEDCCRFLFSIGELGAAEIPLQTILRLNPRAAAAWHNLGTVRMHLGHYDAARSAFAESLRLRPAAENTREALNRAHRLSTAQ